ncbi:MAG TPA: UvrD-helicase domain-containing protein [Polyangiaceae bacterium]
MTRRIDSPNTRADEELHEFLSAKSMGCFVMVAGAGSGKTTSLIKSLAHIRSRYGRRLLQYGQQVACITYTEVAAGEIWGDVGNDPLFHVATIHGFSWALIRSFQSDIKKWVTERIAEKLAELSNERVGFSTRTQQKTRDRNSRASDRLRKELADVGSVRHFTYGTGSRYGKGILGHDDVIRMVPELILERPLLAKLVASKYPYFFVDESQDTMPEVVDALRTVANANSGHFCLGFFGDPMQKIYMTGVGAVEDAKWKTITKPENFRCPTKILAVINSIRADGDGLVQTHGGHETANNESRPVTGNARIFVLPQGDGSSDSIDRVRAWLAEVDCDPAWTNDSEEGDVRILVIEHRMAASRLGFLDLHAAFNDDGVPDALSQGFRDGSAWPLKPFLDVLVPLAEATSTNQQDMVMQLLRKYSARLGEADLKASPTPGTLLANLRGDVVSFAELFSEQRNATVAEVLKSALELKLVSIDDRLLDYLGHQASEAPPSDDKSQVTVKLADGEELEGEASAIDRFFRCPVQQIPKYLNYQSGLSRYATHQGVKGAEFKRVVVVVGDHESRYRTFSYDKLLGIKAPSKTDLDNQRAGKESVFERTRRLFYVCCSRATNSLVVVLYSEDVAEAVKRIHGAGLFESDSVLTADVLTRSKN